MEGRLQSVHRRVDGRRGRSHADHRSAQPHRAHAARRTGRTRCSNGDGGDAELDRVRVMAQAMLRVAGDAFYVDAVAAIDRASSRRRRSSRSRKRIAITPPPSALFNDDRFRRRRCADSRRVAVAFRQQLRSRCSRRCTKPRIAYVSGPRDEAETIADSALAIGAREGLRLCRGARQLVSRPDRDGTEPLRRRRSHDTKKPRRIQRMGDVEQAGADRTTCWPRFTIISATPTLATPSRSPSRRCRFRVRRDSSRSLEQRRAIDSLDSPETALSIQEAALAVARESGREAAIAEVLAQRASLLASLNRASDADGQRP